MTVEKTVLTPAEEAAWLEFSRGGDDDGAGDYKCRVRRAIKAWVAATTIREDAPDAGGGAGLAAIQGRAIHRRMDGDRYSVLLSDTDYGALVSLAATARPAVAEGSAEDRILGGTALHQLAAEPVTSGKLRDSERLDWLELQHVEVRTPLVHGSRANFHASPDDGDGEETPSDLRARIDAALAPTRDASDGEGDDA